ncbi:hypothetical protein FRB95_014622 [Tulasnella sp. JGI-2019a]|nr:hypothetical protein FRB95_014622 [Tulasnella sp. JGI-2019a]
MQVHLLFYTELSKLKFELQTSAPMIMNQTVQLETLFGPQPTFPTYTFLESLI